MFKIVYFYEFWSTIQFFKDHNLGCIPLDETKIDLHKKLFGMLIIKLAFNMTPHLSDYECTCFFNLYHFVCQGSACDFWLEIPFHVSLYIFYPLEMFKGLAAAICCHDLKKENMELDTINFPCFSFYGIVVGQRCFSGLTEHTMQAYVAHTICLAILWTTLPRPSLWCSWTGTLLTYSLSHLVT